MSKFLLCLCSEVNVVLHHFFSVIIFYLFKFFIIAFNLHVYNFNFLYLYKDKICLYLLPLNFFYCQCSFTLCCFTFNSS